MPVNSGAGWLLVARFAKVSVAGLGTRLAMARALVATAAASTVTVVTILSRENMSESFQEGCERHTRGEHGRI